MRPFGTVVQDNPISDTPMYITTEDNKFNLKLKIQGVTIFA